MKGVIMLVFLVMVTLVLLLVGAIAITNEVQGGNYDI
tara:strand:- start:612 stop:722 length:111 start_codon:yes stop_codon:yes gene_type:complete